MTAFSDDELSSGSDQQGRNTWNEVLNIFHLHIGPRFQDFLTEDESGRVALSCHVTLDTPCNKSCPQYPCVLSRAVGSY